MSKNTPHSLQVNTVRALRLLPLILLVAGISRADTIAFGTPPDASTGESTPFGSDLRYQQVYLGSEFGAGPVLIDSISFEYSGAGGTLDPAVYTLSLSTTAKAVNGLSGDFASNVGADSQVFSSTSLGGPFASSSLTFTGTPFLFDPSSGNLLLSISKDATAGGESIFFDGQFGDSGGKFSMVVSPSATGDGVTHSNYGLTTRFDVTSAVATPEPATWSSLMFAGLSLLGVSAWRRTKTPMNRE